MGIVKKLEATADDPESDLEIVVDNLYWTQENRDTEAVFKFTDDATREYTEYIITQLEESDVEYEFEDDEETTFRIWF